MEHQFISLADIHHALGISGDALFNTILSDVEDIYPCSPIQEGMLLSQEKSADFYKFHLICKLSSQNNGPIVLRNPVPTIKVLGCDENNALFLSQRASSAIANRASLPHHLRIRQSDEGNVVIELEMSHVFTDGASTAILLKDLATAYDSNLSIEGPYFSSYIGFLQSSDREVALAFWHDYLEDASPYSLSFPGLRNAFRPLEC
ncbi:putative secondary metabolism biosynthetic enzyme [Metarhizium acridum]|uniref:putative secondary metabolism biosynthetic enzyme n=1 Tax=Metarhizium acridum TaxID=92637 RepID=UPI001C6B6A25|nr:putative secondary metabolism biosynthetic enzyme [Metarhizium acridum]